MISKLQLINNTIQMHCIVSFLVIACFWTVFVSASNDDNNPPILNCHGNVNNITLTDVPGCAAYVPSLLTPVTLVNDYNESMANSTYIYSTTTDVWFNEGVHIITWTAINALGSGDCSIEILVELSMNSSTACGGWGYCNDQYPYSCVCPGGTGGDYCCYAMGYDLSANNTGVICGGHGQCAPGGVCSCDDGFEGAWCCPTGVLFNSTIVDMCSGYGCCTAYGNCTCFDGYTGDDCSIPPGSAVDNKDRNLLTNTQINIAVPLITVGVGVATVATFTLAIPSFVVGSFASLSYIPL